MTEEKYRLADTIIKAVTAFVAIGIATYGVLQYVETARNNSATQTVEREKLLIEKTKLTFELNRQKSEVLSRSAQAAADATWTADRVEQLKAINRYTRLFVGELSLVANQDVTSKGDALNERLEDLKAGLNAQTHQRELDKMRSDAISALNAFVDSCRTQIAQDFLDKARQAAASAPVK